MQEATGKRGNWQLTQENLDALLAAFHADRGEAGRRYESLRQRLVYFFNRRQLAVADALADEVFNRIAKRIEEGERIGTVEAYAYGVARHVAQERVRRDFRDQRAEDAYLWNITALKRTPSEDALLAAVENCLDLRPEAERELLRKYYAARGQELIEHRRQLAASLKLSQGALRKQVFRLRNAVELCVRTMMHELGD
jgi:DNA-directed RNA polymerase specialized sigma24 family protein